jgi:amino acid permease
LAFFKAFVGAGILFLPNGFKNGGLTASILTFIVVTWLSTVGMLRVVESKNRIVREFKAGRTADPLTH